MYKHLAGKHNQQSHAGSNALNVSLDMAHTISLIPINPLLGRARFDSNGMNWNSIRFENSVCVLSATNDKANPVYNELHVNNGGTGPVDEFDAAIDYAKQVGDLVGLKKIKVECYSVDQLPLMLKHGCNIYYKKVKESIIRNMGGGVLPLLTVEQSFKQNIAQALLLKGKPTDEITVGRLADKAIKDAESTPDIVPFSQLNIYGTFQARRVLAEGRTVVFYTDVK